VPPDRSSADEDERPGERFGLPEGGPGSVGGWGRRLIGLAIDWIASQLIVAAFVGEAVWTGYGFVQWAPLLVLWVQTTLLTGLLGTTIGHRVAGLQVLRTDGVPAPIGLARAALRALLLCLAIPPLIWDGDRRGLHDIAGGAVVVNSR
jgi:uncharacterized RDD family membrane protein YckC